MTGVQSCQPDIVERLRREHAKFLGHHQDTSLWLEAADRIEELMGMLDDAKGYVNEAIASYAGDPPSNNFLRGHLAALEVVRDEAFK